MELKVICTQWFIHLELQVLFSSMNHTTMSTDTGKPYRLNVIYDVTLVVFAESKVLLSDSTSNLSISYMYIVLQRNVPLKRC